MDYPKYEGNYLGIVVQNNDPMRQGRVKVFVPHISPTVYSGWTNQQAKDIAFKFVGQNIDSDLSIILDDLKKILPWAPLAMPLAGEMASGRYNDTTKNASTSDSSNLTDTAFNLANASQVGANADGTGEKPGALFDQNAFGLYDAFYDPAQTNANNVNKLSYNYKPETYSNLAKGVFALPRVGAHVWVFFNGGDPLKPVVFAGAYGASDWQGIYDVDFVDDLGQDYPGEYENFSERTSTSVSTASSTAITTGNTHTINTDTYRNKYVINQKGGTLAFVNTDNREMLKLTHYSGSFKEFNNQANIEFAANNDQKLVIGDSFDTVRGTRNIFTQFDSDTITVGDVYRKVGDLGRVTLHENWKKVMDDIADIKQLFDIQRCFPAQGVPSNSKIKLNSSKQVQSGNSRNCPVCTDIAAGGTDVAVNNRYPVDPKNDFIKLAMPDPHSNKYGLATFMQPSDMKQLAQYTTAKGTVVYGTDSVITLNNGQGALVDVEGNTISGSPGYIASTATKIVPCPLCNSGHFAGIGIPNFPGHSPSSFGGVYTPDPTKKTLPVILAGKIPELAKIEAAMGMGGTEIVEIEKNKIETIGMVTNDWGAIRVDAAGKLEPAQVQVFPGFTRVIPAPSPLVEMVQVDDLPGGTYSLNVANRYSVLVGAGGINMKSFGVVNISGAMTNIAGEQINIGSALETNIDGGKRISITGDIVSIKNRQQNGQVLIDSDLGVTGQTIVRGAVYVEGTIYAHAIKTVGKVHTSDLHQIAGSGATTHSPPTPMGTAITSDSTHLTVLPNDGVNIGQGGKPLYLGYTDKARAVGVMPDGMYIGEIPATTITSSQLGFGGGLGTVNILTGEIISLNLPAIAVIAKRNVEFIPTPGVVQTPVPKSLTEISSTRTTPGDTSNLIAALDGENDGAYIPGTGLVNDDGETNMSLRGLPIGERKKIITLYEAKDATTAPIVMYGDGSDVDAIRTAPFQTTHIGPAADYVTTNTGLRMDWMDTGSSGVPITPGHGTNRGIIDNTSNELTP